MIPLELKHYDIVHVKYPVLNNNTAVFLMTYWYGRTKALYDNFIFNKTDKRFFQYIDSYEIFVRALYAAGMENGELKQFISDFANNCFNYLLTKENLIVKSENKKKALLRVFIYFSLCNRSVDLNSKGRIILERLLSQNKFKDKETEAWYKVMLNRKDVSNLDIYDPILRNLLKDNYNDFHNSLSEDIKNAKSRALKASKSSENSKFFLARTIGFYDYSFELLSQGYNHIYETFNLKE